MKKLLLLFAIICFSSTSAFATTVYDVKGDYPEVAGSCTPGKSYDDTWFVYLCDDNKTLKATYCLTYSSDDDQFFAMTKDERITYNQSSALICYQGEGEKGLSQIMEDVSSVTVASSINPLDNKKFPQEAL